MSSYREQAEAEIAVLTKEFLDATEDRYGSLPHIDVFGVVLALSYTPEDSEADDDESFSHDAVGYRFSDQRPWVQVGVLRKALLLAEADE